VGFINYAQIPNSLSGRESLKFLPRRYICFFPNTYLICVCAPRKQIVGLRQHTYKRVIKSGKCFCSFRPGWCRGCALAAYSLSAAEARVDGALTALSAAESSTCTHYLFSRQESERVGLWEKIKALILEPARAALSSLCESYIFRQLK
jgi:hypothetical protein